MAKSNQEMTFEKAYTYFQNGNLEKAFETCQRILQKTPDHDRILALLGIILRKQGQFENAFQSLQKAARINPSDSAYLNSLGNICLDLNQFDKAVRYFKRAIELNPDFGIAYNNLAIAYRKIKKFDKAENSIKKGIELGIVNSDVYNELALILYAKGKSEGAEKACCKALEIDPGSTFALKNLAVIAKWRGDSVTACGYLKKAIKINPDYTEAYYALADMEPLDKENPVFQTMLQLAEKENHSFRDREYLHFALAASFHRQQEYDLAFEHYKKGNIFRLKTNSKAYQPQKYEKLVAGFCEIFNKKFFENRNSWGLASELPVFILGMPRSGTTLVEQILASHQEVHGAGELSFLERIVHEHFQLDMASFAKQIIDFTPVLTAKMGISYLEHIYQLSQTAKRITDKMPFNFFFVWLIVLMFPRAKIIHCIRDPLDNCLSCYMKNFSEDHVFSNDLDYLAHYYKQYLILMQHWKKVLPEHILDVVYEDMVENNRNQTRRILNFCGLNWDDNCLEFHKSKRRVDTASTLQVRQGIYSSSIGRWRKYETHLLDLKEQFQKAEII